MATQDELEGQKRAYARWAPVYDAVYTRFLSDAHRRTAEAAAAAGPDILEVGVGTGLVLPYYPPGARVVGVDLSVDMLRKADDKVRQRGLGHVLFVAAMDGCRLGFRDEAFDAVAVPFVITLVPDPELALDECARVLRPGGEIVIASRLGAEGGLQARAEEVIAPLVKRVGWSSSFRLSRIRSWADARGGIELVTVREGFFKIVRLRKIP